MERSVVPQRMVVRQCRLLAVLGATARIVLGEIGHRLRLIPQVEVMPHDPSAERVETPPPRGLEPGSLVQIRSSEEIAPTLDPTGRNKGLFFDHCEMLPFCGKTFPIKSRVERFVDENTGKLIQLKSDAYILDGVGLLRETQLGQVVLATSDLLLVAGGFARACDRDTADEQR